MNQHTGTPHTERVRLALRLGRFTVAELARMLSVSPMTVSRALRRLVRRAQAKRVNVYGTRTRWTA